jgi:hypothetical protein
MSSRANERTFLASCHCGAIRFRFTSEAITSGRRCNCSICIRKGVVWSTSYYRPDAFELISGADAFAVYAFGDRCVRHCFCKTCGISTFNVIASVPEGYDGPARPGDYRINLGCVEGLDHDALDVSMIDGRSF